MVVFCGFPYLAINHGGSFWNPRFVGSITSTVNSLRSIQAAKVKQQASFGEENDGFFSKKDDFFPVRW